MRRIGSSNISFHFHISHFFLSIIIIFIIQTQNSCNASTNDHLASVPNSSVQSLNNVSVPSNESNNIEQNVDTQFDDSSSMSTIETQKAKIIIQELKTLYKKHILPIEQKYHLNTFLLPKGGEIHDSEFNANPLVLLIGQYSTGKTTFIRHLLGNKDFPGMHIGPEPTTDKFIAFVYGNENDLDTKNQKETQNMSTKTKNDSILSTSTIDNKDKYDANLDNNNKALLKPFQKWNPKKSSSQNKNKSYDGNIIKGNSLTVLPDLPFHSLSKFGSSFLTHFEGTILPAPLLQHLTLIDTPGILSGEKQRLARAYDFANVSKWFADRADMILLLFDAHKLDISDELKEIMETIRPHNEDKIRCVLNKADQVGREELVRVYGSLMWSMGKIFLTPENVRVYIGSFWDKHYKHNDFQQMFDKDAHLLIQELKYLPSVAAERKINELVKRIRLIKVHVCILSRVRKHRKLRRYGLGRNPDKDMVVETLRDIIQDMEVEYNLSKGDMPDLSLFADRLLAHLDWNIFPPRIDNKILVSLDQMLQKDIPNLMDRAGGVNIGRI